jgi:hypothetical protein
MRSPHLTIQVYISKSKIKPGAHFEIQNQARCTFRNPKSIEVTISKSKINRGDHFEIKNQSKYTFQNPKSIQVYVSKSKIKLTKSQVSTHNCIPNISFSSNFYSPEVHSSNFSAESEPEVMMNTI